MGVKNDPFMLFIGVTFAHGYRGQRLTGKQEHAAEGGCGEGLREIMYRVRGKVELRINGGKRV